ncbi:hypothetical protein [Lyngbya confervoides]|uniref:Uncharacterized protein n=1 Tax=Lyngbya confervoides BDU141951 TaxID=1574623 RepID=A0ABD4T1J9_9CYAN|nr:hypothetical protein [Lyngbya confervoides]MCM1982462.1 hypothetical protein [Lyngbya confervoides BDU141951]
MLESLLSETLAVTVDHLKMTAEMIQCAEEAAVDLPEASKQKLNLLHVGVALALQALEDETLAALIQKSLTYQDLGF